MEKKGEQHQDFLLIYFCFTVTKKFVRGPFRVSKMYVVPKIFMQSRRASRFCQSLLSHSAKNFRGETFNVSEDLGHRLFLCINGQLHDFLSKNFCLSAVKYQMGAVFWFKKIQLSKFFMHSLAVAGRVIKFLSTLFDS